MLSRRRFDEAIELHRAGRLSEAAVKYEALRVVEPNDPDLLHCCGMLAGDQARYPLALDFLHRAIALAPGRAHYRHSLAITLERMGDLQAAAAAYNDQANLLLGERDYPAALIAYEAAVRLHPGCLPYRCNRAVALTKLGRFEDAIVLLRHTPDEDRLSFVPLNLGNALMGLGQVEEAIVAYDRALVLEPDLVEAHWARGQALLALGRYAEGWPEYEWRRRWSGYSNPYAGRVHEWRNETPQMLDGPLLVTSEQGFGDAIQFARYIPLLVEAGYHIVFEVREQLRKLFEAAFASKDVSIVAREAAIDPGASDYALVEICRAQIPLLSLPMWFRTDRTSILPCGSHLRAKGKVTSPTPGKQSALRIGIVRQGRAQHANDSFRSIPAAAVAPLLARKANFFSLQVEPFGVGGVVELGTKFRDFSDTAAAIATMDLVISVDTAVAHLAGAMGVPVWVMLPHAPDWRWGRSGDTTPWYPNARLFRQDLALEWSNVIEAVGDALDRLAAGGR